MSDPYDIFYFCVNKKHIQHVRLKVEDRSTVGNRCRIKH